MRLFLCLTALIASTPAWAGQLPIPPIPVPEPATLALLAAGLGALVMSRRRRK